jgi:hypothetical protein
MLTRARTPYFGDKWLFCYIFFTFLIYKKIMIMINLVITQKKTSFSMLTLALTTNFVEKNVVL